MHVLLKTYSKDSKLMGSNLNNFFYQLLFNIIINIIIVEYVIIIIGHLSKTNIAQCDSH